MAVTLKQIAEMAGVSRGTVDRVLHNRGRVNAEVAAHVRKIAEELGYRPNRIGRALALANKELRIGVVVQSAETPFMQMVLAGVERSAETLREMGAEVIVCRLESVDVEQEIACINHLLQSGIHGLALLPTDDPRLRDKINEIVKDRLIPVVTFNSDILETERMCFVGLDNYRSAQTAAGLMALALRQGGKVLPLTGHLTNQAHKQRVGGFVETVRREYPQMELLPLQPCFDMDDFAYELTMHTLQEHPDLSGIFVAANGQSGVCRAMEASGKKNQVCIITYDLTPQNQRHLLAGNIDIVIDQNAFTQGYQPSIILHDYLFLSKLPEREFWYTDILIKTRYNL